MRTWRTARGVADYYKQIDADTAISEWYVRQLIVNGDIPHISNGNRQLVCIEDVERYLEDARR